MPQLIYKERTLKSFQDLGRRTYWTLPILLVLLFQCSSGSGPQPIDDNDSIDTKLTNLVAVSQVPSVAAGIITENGIAWSGAFGYKDVARQIPPTQATVYVLASLSKLVIASAAMQLVEKGLLDLHGDINDILPFPVRNPHYPETPITMHMLLTHRSGLAWPNGEDPNFYSNFPDDGAPELGPWLEDYLLPNGSQYVAAMWKATQPGDVVSYSNVGAALAGYVVEAAAGMDYAEYCRQHLFEPLEMFNTSYRNEELDLSDMALLYSGATSTSQPYSVPFYPATTVKSSIEELSHFVMAYLNGGMYKGTRILSEESVAEVLKLQVAGSSIGLFWWARSGGWHGHTGSYTGASSSLYMNPARKRGMIILSNLGNQDTVWPNGSIFNAVQQEALTIQ